MRWWSRRRGLGLRPLQHQLAHASRIGLAAHGLHDGTDHGAGRLHFALADLFENIRLRRERRVDGRNERTVVRSDLQAARLDDLGRRALPRDDTLDDLTRKTVGQGPGVDEGEDGRDIRRRD